LPAVSTAKYFKVVVVEMLIGAPYTVEAVVGVEPSKV
jgi:hypothetical protein